MPDPNEPRLADDDVAPTRAPTLGESRVRVSFNPSSNTVVDQIKRMSAHLIDHIQLLPKPDDPVKRGEFMRLCALANTAYEEAAMWAVKAATI